MSEPEVGSSVEDWRIAALGEVVTFQRGRDLPRQDRLSGRYPVIGSNGTVGHHRTYVTDGPGVCVGRSGSVGKVLFVREPFWPLNTTLWVKDFHGNDPEFVYYFLQTLHLSRYSAGVSVPTLNRNLLHPIEVRIPPLHEQRAIASVLRTVQRAREQTEQVIAAARELKRSLMRHLFTYGPVPVSEAESIDVQTWKLGEHPADWSAETVGDLATVRAGHGFPPRLQGRRRGKYPFYKVSDMTSPGNERVMTRANNYVDDPALAEIKAKPMEAGAVIFPKVGAAVATNKKRMLGQPAVFDNNIMGVEITRSDLIRPDFLYRWFENLDLVALSNPGPLPSITAQAVKSAELPLPSIEIQEEIARALLAVDLKIEAEEKCRVALDALFGSLLHELMTARLRVDHLASEFA